MSILKMKRNYLFIINPQLKSLNEAQLKEDIKAINYKRKNKKKRNY